MVLQDLGSTIAVDCHHGLCPKVCFILYVDLVRLWPVLLHRAGFKKMNPFCIPFAITNMSGALLAMDLGFMGPNYAINTGTAGRRCPAGVVVRGRVILKDGSPAGMRRAANRHLQLVVACTKGPAWYGVCAREC